ncbi:phage tail tip fiber protein, partial [Aeromonas caviae]|uniref:phage tail tip fiber protein n=1 Tax=Aeromonas caviae TaxID=648 RepID=UPI002B465DCC
DYQAADSKTTAALEESNRTLSAADQAMAERVTQLQAALEGDDKTLNAAILETQRTQAQGDKALSEQISQLQAKVTNGDTALSSAIQQTQQAQAAGDKANADAITKVQATLNSTTAAVQTVASAVADLEGDVEAGWYTKAQIAGEGGGFGLSVKLNADGTVLSTFVIDADVFAVMSRAGGANTKRNPFIIKNGTVYMNHAMMDTAEIGNVIAKYIKVTNLSAVTIENSQFKGGNAGFGPGGPYSGWGEGWHTIIYNDGRIFTNRLYAADGSFTGEVNANRGTFNNVVIRENCQILGSLDVNQVVGDITQLIRALANFSIPAYRRARNIVCLNPVTAYGSVSGQGSVGMIVVCYLNGVEVARATKTEYVATGGTRYMSAELKPAFEIPANTQANITFDIFPVGGGTGLSSTGFTGQAVWLTGLK